MTPLRRALVVISLVPVIAAGSASLAAAQETTTSAPQNLDTTLPDDAPVIDLEPADAAEGDADGSDGATAGKIVVFVAAIALPLAGIAFLVWFTRRAAARAAARASGDPDSGDQTR